MPALVYMLLLVGSLILMASSALGQEPLQECSGWMATVDDTTQQIVLQWNRNSDTRVAGYHLCTGQPCLDYDTLYGREDTAYICVGHSAEQPHLYRLHAFDSLRQPSALTPPFGNMVLQAEVPDCATEVIAHWTPYPSEGIGHVHYTLQGLLEPQDTAYRPLFSTDDSSQLYYAFQLPDGVQTAQLRVVASIGEGRVSHSNTLLAHRRTADTASAVDISAVEYDSVHTTVQLILEVDPRFDYHLYRSIDGSPWRELSALHPTSTTLSYVDADINPYDSLHCYQLEVRDACGLNPRYSATTCLVVPDPPEPRWFFPNALLVGDERDGTFLPAMQGLRGDLYELHIYNRAGQLVFHSTDDHQGWTPTPSTPVGTYVYTLRCRFNNNMIHRFSGSITVIQ